ncbi:AhpC/TSA family protein [Soonwooa buanensis]|uniref:AhpC/TSA family protein n=1 Tax=Soonwooa buanensis TaxID=619805 RepID=A0A1T5GTC2_9FLAO|nr:TlpA family protein disulfide reductase [Soonwooa buanensis]SKC11646.1 AhpC/TSA family protein [Soonwooa buanensis]
MKKFLKAVGIIFLILIGFVILIQFVGFNIGSVHIGKAKNDLRAEKINTFENSNFQNEILNSDKLTCINIWATWCVPCVEEMPELNKIKAEFESKNVQFASLSIDTDSAKLQKFIDSKKFHFEDLTLVNVKYKNAILNFLEKKPLNFENTTQAIPLTYLVKNGKVIHKIEGGTDATELRKLINENL